MACVLFQTKSKYVAYSHIGAYTRSQHKKVRDKKNARWCERERETEGNGLLMMMAMMTTFTWLEALTNWKPNFTTFESIEPFLNAVELAFATHTHEYWKKRWRKETPKKSNNNNSLTSSRRKLKQILLSLALFMLTCLCQQQRDTRWL